MTYSEAIEFLYGLRQFGAKLGLENTRRLAALAGSPETRLRFIHVAGTNGKGSVCAMLESIYRAAGWRTGLFTSPHLVAFGERIQVNRVPMTEGEVVGWVGRMKTWLEAFSVDEHPTFFEVVTVMALGHFAERQCQVVLWETGMGGRLDATNIVTPAVSVITNIGLDHQKWLGSTMEEIAGEKAGIIKPGVPVVTAVAAGPGRRVLEDVARAVSAPLRLVGEAEATDPRLRSLPLALAGEHQWSNAALARAVVDLLQAQWPVSMDAFREGLRGLQWPGRMQMVPLADGRTLLLDGAHNPEGLLALLNHVRGRFGEQPLGLVFGVLADKDWPAMLDLLTGWRGPICLVPVESVRSASGPMLKEELARRGPGLEIRACADLAEAWCALASQSVVVLTGSLYLVGEAMSWLGLSAAPGREERTLNEWQGRHDEQSTDRGGGL